MDSARDVAMKSSWSERGGCHRGCHTNDNDIYLISFPIRMSSVELNIRQRLKVSMGKISQWIGISQSDTVDVILEWLALEVVL